VRFGSFENLYYKGEHSNLTKLADYVIKYHFEDLVKEIKTEEEKYLLFYKEVVRRTAYMIATWQAFGKP
jgi:uncharacterized protein YdiU (UPF0061 family)